MKKLLVALLAIVVLASCGNQKTNDSKYTITGSIDSTFSNNIYLLKREKGNWVNLDTSVAINGIFEFNGSIEMPEVYYIQPEGTNQFASLFVESGKITFKAEIKDFRNPEITGSESQKKYEDFKDHRKTINQQQKEALQNIEKAQQSGNEEEQQKWEQIFDELDEEYVQYILDYANANNNCVVSAYVVLRNAFYFDETDIEPVVNNFDPSITNSVYVKSLTERVEILKNVAVGKPAIDFTMNDANGNPVTLSSQYGKYLLVDFWASWCSPCRAENPNIVAIYKDFNAKGFDVFGVSFDDDKDKWLKAVADDDLTWSHVSDLQGWGNTAGKLYAINSIPSNILLDPEGNIIAKNLRGEDLRNKITELLGE